MMVPMVEKNKGGYGYGYELNKTVSFMVRIWNGFLLHMLKKITEENIINFSL